MTMPRRRLVRSAVPGQHTVQAERRVQKLRTRLEAERTALVRWQRKLRRAFNAVEKCQRSIQRLEHQLARLED